ncbi:MAG: hypothetical protein ABEJ88_02480 [Halobacterium sp.]
MVAVWEGVTLLVLFLTQVLVEFAIIQTVAEPHATELSILVLYAYTAVYLALAAVLFVRRRAAVVELVRRTVGDARSAFA